MSDPVTNAEVEDVLSSIRRLVSEEKRPLQPAKPVTPVKGAAPDRLVLTPALRVMDDNAVTEPAESALADAQAADSADVKETLILGRAAEPSTDFSEQPEVDHTAIDDVPEDEAVAAPSKPATTLSGGNGSLGAKIEALETAIGNISDQWEPDTPGADAYSGTELAAMAWEDDVPTSDPADADIPELKQEQDEDVTEAHKGAAAPGATAKADAKDDDADGFVFETDDQVLDEEALRDLISEIVREELQGALGERITRNVRKLVRREIHRALTAQELE